MKSLMQLSYPETRKGDAWSDYFGTRVPDPYRWLEDDRSPETEAWVKAQNKVSFDYLEKLPERDRYRKRLEELYNYPRRSAPRKVGDYYLFAKNEGLQNQAVYYIQKGLEGTPEVFLDPNTLSDSGIVSVNLLGSSPDDRYIAYSRSEAGSDWSEIRIIEVATGEELPDRLEWVKFSGTAWLEDGFFYSRYPAPEAGKEYSGASEFHKVYFHRLGESQEDDLLIYEDQDEPNMYHQVVLTEEKEYMILYKSSGTDGYETYFKPTDRSPGGFTLLHAGFKHKNSIVDFWEGHFFIQTDIEAPNYRLVKVHPEKLDVAHWEEIIPEKPHVLEGVSRGGNKLFASYLENAFTQIYQYNHAGEQERQIEMPGPGTAMLSGGKREDQSLFLGYSSYTYPGAIFQYEISTGDLTPFFQTVLTFNPDDFITTQVWYTSKDGTRVSMFLTYKKGLELKGENPTYLYGYGGFNVPLTPGFSASTIVLLEEGGIMAVANLRGGSEYGEAWHKAGMLDKKQNVFDDFIAAAEFLIAEGYTKPDHLAIAGGSNGGLLVGAAMTQCPEMFAVALPAVGVLDMLRYHKFTVGWGWVPEYGNAENSKEEFSYLYAYSPLHNLHPGTSYPATMITTADHDDRVVPAHSFKFAAALQRAHTGENPVIIRIETNAGHGAGKPISKILDEQADKWAFMLYHTKYILK